MATPAASTAATKVPSLVVNSVEVYAIAVFLTFKAATTTAFASTFAWASANNVLYVSAAV